MANSRTYQQIKTDLENTISNCSNGGISLNSALSIIKSSIEDVILTSGNVGKGNLIRTKKLINLLHEVIKTEFINAGVDANRVFPRLGHSGGELKLSGILKSKDQDVSLVPNNSTMNSEVLNHDGILKNYTDVYGKNHTEKILTVNVRSQLSSFAKNFDTLYERTFAEAYNLHKRCPSMVLGEFYMIAVNEYDTDYAKQNQIHFTQTNNVERHIEKYLMAFDAINDRTNTNNDKYKYERVCLLIVDFNRPVPKVYNTDAELIADNLLPQNPRGSIQNLTFGSFVDDLLSVYQTRFGTGRFS